MNLLALDVDGTSVKPYSAWQYLMEKTGVWNNIGTRHLDLFLSNKIDYEEFCQLDANTMEGITEKHVIKIFSCIPHFEGIDVLSSFLKDNNWISLLISGGLSHLCQILKDQYDFTDFIANELEIKDNILTGLCRIRVPWDGKKKILTEYINALNIPEIYVVAVGDSTADKGLFEVANKSIAFNPRDEDLVKVADHVITSESWLDVVKILEKE